ncbi:MAG: hypothetical protein PVJ57_11400 [Phycisphaerae bacterium]|jgi:hypothetical protein
MAQRVTTILLLAVAAAAGALLSASLYHPAGDAARPGLPTTAQRWNALPPGQRAAYLREYQVITARADAAAVFARAETFDHLSEAEQVRLRRLHATLYEVMEKLPKSRLQSLLALDGRARAEAVLNLLEAESPALFKALRDEFRGHS